MASYNKVILVGNLTRSPETKFLPSGTGLCEFGLAVNDKYTAKDGTKKEDVLFIDCVIFGKQAETFQKYMAKGKPVLVEGRLKFQSWQAKDGTKRSKHVLNVDRFVFLGEGKPAAPATESNFAPPDDNENIPF